MRGRCFNFQSDLNARREPKRARGRTPTHTLPLRTLVVKYASGGAVQRRCFMVIKSYFLLFKRRRGCLFMAVSAAPQRPARGGCIALSLRSRRDISYSTPCHPSYQPISLVRKNAVVVELGHEDVGLVQHHPFHEFHEGPRGSSRSASQAMQTSMRRISITSGESTLPGTKVGRNFEYVRH